MKAWGHGGLRYTPLQELEGQTGQITADTVMRCFPFPLPFPHVNMSLGDFSHRKTARQVLSTSLPRLPWPPRQQAPGRPGGSAEPSIPCPRSGTARSGGASEGRVHLRFSRRRDKLYLQKENWKDFYSPDIKGRESLFLLVLVFQWL